ncbi:hypothetical protein [Nocardioides marmotae]|uniref:Uncharacterized protein n=1 Tax=Nocardioides marmotae TaxID=2663857 RepID=A0A6I3IUJ3_9ACTN|nr:hypothetical protein [Nocardioides marmotae]MCR6030497.1 hypothetical protein [Gordonia jinghuaiqii]MBC9734628.1 hypothetical protein [Nocardioides marmotae]MTB85730.1 hypothetical protein [Nocardioides marmotae]MTB94133.1 hypothetical protein [Nocardioides marmotae]QKE00429.1 hypothetical protein HPC71_04550 [Nocardioides marmotae]
MAEEFQYLENPQTAKLFDLVLQLATELHVERHRLRALESMMVRKGYLHEGELDAFSPTDAESRVLDEARTGYLARLVRIITENGPAEHPLREQWEELLARKQES